MCVTGSMELVSFPLKDRVPLQITELAHPQRLLSDRGDLCCGRFPSGQVKVASCLRTLATQNCLSGPSFWKGSDSLTQTAGTTAGERRVLETCTVTSPRSGACGHLSGGDLRAGKESCWTGLLLEGEEIKEWGAAALSLCGVPNPSFVVPPPQPLCPWCAQQPVMTGAPPSA